MLSSSGDGLETDVGPPDATIHRKDAPYKRLERTVLWTMNYLEGGSSIVAQERKKSRMFSKIDGRAKRPAGS